MELEKRNQELELLVRELLSRCQRQVLFQENAEVGFPSFERKHSDHFSFLEILNDFPSRLNILA